MRKVYFFAVDVSRQKKNMTRRERLWYLLSGY